MRERLTIRDIMGFTGLTALLIGYVIQHVRADRLRAEVDAVNILADAEQADAQKIIADLRARLAECLERHGEAE